TALDWTTKLAQSAELDLVSANELNQGAANAQTVVAIASTSGLTATGAVQLVRLTFNITAGFSGTIVPTINVTEALPTNTLIHVTSTVAVQTLPTLTIP